MKSFMFNVFRMLTVLCLVAGQGCGPPTHAQSPAAAAPAQKSTASAERVMVGLPARKTLTLHTTQPGRIRPFEETPLHPKVSGYVESIAVDIGDRVKKGETLLSISVPELQDELGRQEALLKQSNAEVRQAEAAVNAAQAAARTSDARLKGVQAGLERFRGEYDRWNAEYARIKELAQSGTVTSKLVDETLSQFRAADASRAEAEAAIESARAVLEESRAMILSAEADLVTAHAKVAVAEANVQQARTMLGYATIVAPYDGVITKRSVDTGHLVQQANSSSSEPLLVIARADVVRVFVDVPETEAPFVTSGREGGDPVSVTVQALGSRSFESSIVRTSWTLNPANRSLLAEVDVPNPEGLLRPGMYASISIQLEQHPNVLTVPATAIVREGTATLCCLVVDGKIVRRAVETGLRSGDEVEVLSGLAESDRVVLARANSLREGQPVEVLPDKK